MKLLIILLITISTLNIYSNECATELMHDYGRSDEITDLPNSGATMNKERVIAWANFFSEPPTKECIEMMDVFSYIGKSGKVYTELHTNDDECDGGNVYGVVLNMDNEVVIEISDSEFYCPNAKMKN